MKSGNAGMADAVEAEESIEAGAYRQAGVDIDAGARAVELMRRHVRSTFGPRVLADLGHFGGLYALSDDPDGQVLVASADGVGTKLKLAYALGTHRNAGMDIVNHCINDILTCGARPIFFLDYIASGKVVPEQIAEVVTGMAGACRQAGCALLGGETAEMPGIYHDGEYDVAGFIVGTVARDRLLLGDSITPGDTVLALPSNGLHTNGYSLARKVFGLEGSHEEMRERLNRYEPELGRTLGETLTEPHRSYLPEVAPLLDLPERPIKGMAHITGGGLVDNIPRILPEGCAIQLDASAWEVPPVFRLIEKQGQVSPDEMARVFNMGIGMVLVVAPENVPVVIEKTPDVMRIGKVIKHESGGRVQWAAGSGQ
jgi:phosphoribosylformylglycinamidine cyclo-ligase